MFLKRLRLRRFLGSDFGRTDFSRIFIFEPPDFFADFVAGFFLLIFVGKSAQKNPPGKSPAKFSKTYTTKIPDNFLQRGQAKIFDPLSRYRGSGASARPCRLSRPLQTNRRELYCMCLMVHAGHCRELGFVFFCCFSVAASKLGRHLVGVWIGGVWNGHFPESEKHFSEAEFSRKIPEIPQKERFLPNFRLRNLKIQSPKNCNSIPPAIPYPH